MSTDAGACTATVNFEATATDNCSATITYSHASGTAFGVGTTVVTVTVTDISGNISTCAFNVTVGDTEYPVVSCPG